MLLLLAVLLLLARLPRPLVASCLRGALPPVLLRAALVASCMRGALPPVLLRAVCGCLPPRPPPLRDLVAEKLGLPGFASPDEALPSAPAGRSARRETSDAADNRENDGDVGE